MTSMSIKVLLNLDPFFKAYDELGLEEDIDKMVFKSRWINVEKCREVLENEGEKLENEILDAAEKRRIDMSSIAVGDRKLLKKINNCMLTLRLNITLTNINQKNELLKILQCDSYEKLKKVCNDIRCQPRFQDTKNKRRFYSVCSGGPFDIDIIVLLKNHMLDKFKSDIKPFWSSDIPKFLTKDDKLPDVPPEAPPAPFPKPAPNQWISRQ